MFEGISPGTPGCEVLFVSEQPCGRGAVVRLWARCNDCGHRVLRFFCEGHVKGSLAGKVACYHCKSARLEFKVS